MATWDWKWIIGSVVIPIGTFIIGLFLGKKTEQVKIAKAKVKGEGNITIQNSKVDKIPDRKNSK